MIQTYLPSPCDDSPSEQGRYRSEVLGLEFELAEGKLRLWAGNALLLESHELLERWSG